MTKIIDMLKQCWPALALVVIVCITTNLFFYSKGTKEKIMTEKQYKDSLKSIKIQLDGVRTTYLKEAIIRLAKEHRDSILISQFEETQRNDKALISLQRNALSQYKGRTNHSLLSAIDSAYEANNH